jgi:hypothetical protein
MSKFYGRELKRVDYCNKRREVRAQEFRAKPPPPKEVQVSIINIIGIIITIIITIITIIMTIKITITTTITITITSLAMYCNKNALQNARIRQSIPLGGKTGRGRGRQGTEAGGRAQTTGGAGGERGGDVPEDPQDRHGAAQRGRELEGTSV